MGLIRAALSAVGSTLHDQWLDAIKCEDMGESLLMVRKTTENGVISKGSRIIVNPGQIALIVDTGNILDATAEPGNFVFDTSTEASFFGGDFGKVFKEMWERFKYNGTPAREQAVYFINSKEILDNKFGTPAPVPYKDWGHPTFNPRNNAYYAMAVQIKAFGSFTYKITDPFVFMNRIAGTAQRFTKEMLTEQMRSEFIAAFKNTLAELGSEAHKVEAMDLPHKDDEIIAAMQEKDYDRQINGRGITIISVAVESITFDDDSRKKIHDYELSDAYSQSGYIAGATGRAMEAAGNNPGGAMGGFVGVGMAQGIGGAQNVLNTMVERQAGQVNQAAAPLAQTAHTWACACGGQDNTGKFCMSCGKAKPVGTGMWTCACGTSNSGKFCADCGKPRPANKPEDGTWLCACGTENVGKFCADCGAKKPAGTLQFRCDKCGWEPADKSKPPKFCEECGDPFDENDIV